MFIDACMSIDHCLCNSKLSLRAYQCPVVSSDASLKLCFRGHLQYNSSKEKKSQRALQILSNDIRVDKCDPQFNASPTVVER